MVSETQCRMGSQWHFRFTDFVLHSLKLKGHGGANIIWTHSPVLLEWSLMLLQAFCPMAVQLSEGCTAIGWKACNSIRSLVIQVPEKAAMTIFGDALNRIVSAKTFQLQGFDHLSLQSIPIGGLQVCVLSCILAWHQGSFGLRGGLDCYTVSFTATWLCEDLFSAAIRNHEQSRRR